MRMYDIIETKKRNGVLSDAEINFAIGGFVDGQIPDYQMAALLMAIWFNGMDAREITTLTTAMAHSGDMIDLSAIDGKNGRRIGRKNFTRAASPLHNAFTANREHGGHSFTNY